MSMIPNRAKWFMNDDKLSIINRQSLIDLYLKSYFIRTNEMFEYEGLPETIPKKDYLLIKQRFGSVTIARNPNDNKVYAFNGGLGGELNEYYHPTISIVTNPWLRLSETFKIDEDCVVILNDVMYEGLFRHNLKYAELMADCDISIRMALINCRLDNVFVSSDGNTDTSIEKFMNDAINGNMSHIVTKKFQDTALFDIHRSQSTNDRLKQLIEMKNFIDSSWYIDFGLNANYNMKRETLTDAETNVDDKTLIPLIEDMLNQEIEGWKKANAMFGLNVKPKLSNVWAKMFDEVLNPKDEPNQNDEPKDDNVEGGEADEKDE